MTLREAKEYCQEHKCQDCSAYLTDNRTAFDRDVEHLPCWINLVDDEEKAKYWGGKDE